MATLTHSTGVIVPFAVYDHEGRREARTIVHQILGRPDPDVTLRPPALRAGRMSLMFETEAAAIAAVAVLRIPQVLTLSGTGAARVDMSFVVAGGDIENALYEETAGYWSVVVPFHEVAP